MDFHVLYSTKKTLYNSLNKLEKHYLSPLLLVLSFILKNVETAG